MYWIGVDTGGTFTDLVTYNSSTGELRSLKTPSTPNNHAAGVMRAFDLVTCKIFNDNGEYGIGYITVHENQGYTIYQPLILRSCEASLIRPFERGQYCMEESCQVM